MARYVSLVVLVLVLAPLAAPLASSAEAMVAKPRGAVPGKAMTIGYAWLVLSAEQLPWLVGADIRSLQLAACINGELVAGEVYVLPRSLSPSFEAELNKTIYTPVYGSTRVQENDLLLLLVPYSPVSIHSLPVHRAVAEECRWGRHYALLRLHDRVKVVIKQLAGLGHALLWHSPMAPAPGSLVFYIYFDEARGRGSPVYPSSTPDTGLVASLARRLGIAPGSDAAWYTRLRSILYERVEGVHVEAVVERAKGWVMSSNYSRIVEVLTSPIEGGTPSTINYIDGGGSGSLRFYWFTLSLDPGLPGKPVKLAPGRELYPSTIYLGPYVEDIGLHVKVRNNSSRQACVEVGLFVYRYESGSQGGRYDPAPLVAIDRRYLVSPSAVSVIEVTPSSIPWSSTKLGARPFVRNCGGTSIEVVDATLDFLKSYPSMPVEEQREGLEILSYGIKIIDPRESRVAKYVEAETLPGLYFVAGPGDNRFSYSFSYPEGIYLDYNYGEDDGAILVLDVAVRAPYSSIDGYLRIYVNGYEASESQLHVPGGGYKILRLNIPLRLYTDYFKWMGGGVVTIEASFNDYAVIYIDSMIKYNYLPEVYDARLLTRWWHEYPSPAAKFLLACPWKDAVVLEASYTVERPYVSPEASQDLVFGLEASSTKTSYMSITSGVLVVKVPRGIVGEMPPVGTYKHEHGYSELDEIYKYIGVANTLHHILSTAVTVIGFVADIGEKASGILFVAGTIIDIIKAAKGQAVLKTSGVETINGVEYNVYKYSWSAGWAEHPHWIQMRVYVQAYSSSTGSFTVYLSGGVDGYKLRPVAVRIVLSPGVSAPYEPHGFYGRGDIGYS